MKSEKKTIFNICASGIFLALALVLPFSLAKYLQLVQWYYLCICLLSYVDLLLDGPMD